MRRVSRKRQRENYQRRKNLLAAFGPNPTCVFPECGDWAADAHEILFRSRGGSITDPDNIAPLCRVHHDWVTANPRKAAVIGLARSRYEEPA